MGVDIALFFGSFNPIHYGHIAIIKEVAQRFDFQQIQLVVSPQSPYKTEKARFPKNIFPLSSSYFQEKKAIANDQLAPFKDRVEMCRLVVSTLNKQRKDSRINHDLTAPKKEFLGESSSLQKKFFFVNTIESKLPLPNYTHITLKEIMFLRKATYTLLLGEDNYQTLSKWNEGQWIIENFPLIVYPRYSDSEQSFKNSKTKKEMQPDKRYTDSLQKNEENTHFLIGVDYLPISASQVRKQIAMDKNVDSLIPHKVAQYIDKKKLYTNS